jgi:hypothetical protein
MVELPVAEAKVTVCADPYDPPTGEKVTFATAPLMTYAAVWTEESVYPALVPIAFMVREVDTETGEAYWKPWTQFPLPSVVGVDPSVV